MPAVTSDSAAVVLAAIVVHIGLPMILLRAHAASAIWNAMLAIISASVAVLAAFAARLDRSMILPASLLADLAQQL